MILNHLKDLIKMTEKQMNLIYTVQVEVGNGYDGFGQPLRDEIEDRLYSAAIEKSYNFKWTMGDVMGEINDCDNYDGLGENLRYDLEDKIEALTEPVIFNLYSSK